MLGKAAEAACRRSGRVRYTKTVGGMRKYVIADLLEDGGGDFAESEVGEVRWYPFEPTPEEAEAARKLLAGAPSAGNGWGPAIEDKSDLIRPWLRVEWQSLPENCYG
jgi:hypothetical protein